MHVEIYGYYFFFRVGSVILDVIQCVYIAKWVTGPGWVGWRERERVKSVWESAHLSTTSSSL